MQKVPLAIVANQTFSILLEGKRYKMTFKATNGCMSATIVRDGATIVSNQRCVAQEPILPYLSSEDGEGNFIFYTLLDDLPDWQQFNSTQELYYVSNAELEAIRGV